jgi:hypothetical protein
MVPLTRGARLVRQQIIGQFAARLPIALAAAREAWDLTPVELPDPVRYSPWEPLSLDERLPLVAVAVARARGFTATDIGEYQARYFCSVFGWLKGDEYGPPQDSRDDFASVLASVLLDSPSLGGTGFGFDAGTLEINYSDAAKVKGDRWLAGVSLGFQVTHTEKLRTVPIGVVDPTLLGGAVEVDLLAEVAGTLVHPKVTVTTEVEQ